MLGFPFYIFAQNKSDTPDKNKKDSYIRQETSFYNHKYPSNQKRNIFISFGDWLNNAAYAESAKRHNDRKLIRQEWKDFFGVDVFYPYFKYKETEDKIKEKTSVRIFKMKGRAELSTDNIGYTFKIKF